MLCVVCVCVACVCVRVCVWCCTWCVGWGCCDTSGLGSSRSSSAHTTLRVVCEKKRGRSATQNSKSSWSCPHRGKISGGENSPERTTPKPARATHPPRPKNTRSPRGVSFLGPSPSPSCSSSSWLITVLSSWPFYEHRGPILLFDDERYDDLPAWGERERESYITSN